MDTSIGVQAMLFAMATVNWVGVWHWLARQDWGSVPAWFSAFVSLLALVIASLAARAAWKQVKNTASQMQQRDDQEKRSQAEKVSAWLVQVPDDGRLAFTELRLRVANANTGPVYDFSATCMGMAVDGQMTLEPTQPGGKEREATMFSNYLVRQSRHAHDNAIKYSATADEKVRETHAMLVHTGLVHDALLDGLHVHFRDSAGRKWTRTGDGILLEGTVNAADRRRLGDDWPPGEWIRKLAAYSADGVLDMLKRDHPEWLDLDRVD